VTVRCSEPGLLECQAIAKLALAGNRTDPVLAVKSLRTEGRGQQAVVNVEDKVKLSALSISTASACQGRKSKFTL
jgi:hypothetical protein